VACRDKPDQSYALYLPTGYAVTKAWPLIAAFDPAARGSLPLERFKEAAERYGFIVCGSNNSRNGPWAPTAEAAEAMLNDVTARFPIDDKRIYLTGFSGGARVATRMAIIFAGRVAGVIGCGAGFPTGIAPPASLTFSYFGAIGNEDFNYPEMKQLDRDLAAGAAQHRIQTFDGGHAWPPSELCVRAVGWLEIQAMKSGRRPRAEDLVDHLFAQARADATQAETAGRVYDAWLSYRWIVSDFKGLRDVSEFEKKAGTLREAKPVQDQAREDRRQEDEQRRRFAELFGMRSQLRDPATVAALRLIDPGAPADGGRPGGVPPGGGAMDERADRQIAFADLKSKLSELRRRADAGENTPARAVARRILGQYMALIFEPIQSLLRAGKYDAAIADLSIDAALLPDNWAIQYNLCRAYAMKGDRKRALQSLDKAIQKGFSNPAELERNRELDPLRDDPEFKRLLRSLPSLPSLPSRSSLPSLAGGLDRLGGLNGLD
jgi:pimeloyl-ACP methyl ester carboxylesterase